MSSRHRGRGRGGRNPLAPPFQQLPLHQTPTSPENTRMDEGQASPVHTAPAPPSSTSSAREIQPFEYPAPRKLASDMRDTNLGTRLRLINLEEAFSAMQAHLKVVQNRHIDDIQSLEDQVESLTSQVSTLKEQLLQYQTTTPAPRPPHLPPPPVQTWAQKAARTAPGKPSTTQQNKESTSSVLTKCDRTIVIERDGSPLPDSTNTLTIRDAINTAIKKPLIAMIEFSTNHHVLLLTKDNTPASSVLKNHHSVIEEAIRATIPAATGLRKDEIWHKVILHGIPTTTTFNTVQSEIEECNPGTHLPRPPRWLTTVAQRQDKAASAMVLTIAGKDSTEKALSRGLSLLGKKFKVQRYLSFGPDSQCTKCLAFGHHPSQCTGTQHCNICSLEHPAHLHTCGRSDCPTKGKACLHTTIRCSNCGEPHQANSKECPIYLKAHQAATERRNRAT